MVKTVPYTVEKPSQVSLNDGKKEGVASHQGSGKAPPSRQSIFRVLGSDIWFYEILSLFGAIFSFMSIIILLWLYDGRAAPSWTRPGITLNVVISWISNVVQTCLMMPVAECISQLCWVWFSRDRQPLQDTCYYDSASRGPLGSILLLYHLKARRFVCIGAIITLLMVGLNPFFQQTVQFVTVAVPDPGQTAKAVAAYAWDGYTGALSGTMSNTMATAYSILPRNMKASMLSGLLAANSDSSPNPLFSCPSGNCTWEPFSTLAVGSQCIDVTHLISLNCSTKFQEGHATVDTNDNKTVCAFNVTGDPAWRNNLVAEPQPQTMMVMGGGMPDMAPLNEWDFFNISGVFGTGQWIKAISGYINSSSPDFNTYQGSALIPGTQFESKRCNFYFMVKEVQPEVINGIYTEKELNRMVSTANYQKNGTALPSDLYPEPLVYTPPFAKPNANNNGTFTVDTGQTMVLGSELGYLLSGNVTYSFGSYFGFQDETGQYYQLSDILMMLWQTQNLTKSMDNLALYMTNALRNNNSELLEATMGNNSLIAPNQAVTGTVWVQQQIVVVHWFWLTLPVTLILSVSAFLLITIIKTSHANIGVWKSSPLALLFHATETSGTSYPRWRDAIAGDVHTADKLKDAAAKVSAKIESNGKDGEVQLSVPTVQPLSLTPPLPLSPPPLPPKTQGNKPQTQIQGNKQQIQTKGNKYQTRRVQETWV